MRILKPSVSLGWKRISFSYKNITGNASVARVVLWTFDCPPDDLKPHCDHKNRTRDDNHLSNLRWVTRSENNINQGPRTMNQDREKHPEPDGWELHKYHDHRLFPKIAA